MSLSATLPLYVAKVGRHARADVGGHGRDAAHPAEIPPRGWRDVLLRSWREVSDANLFLVAGGVTYAILLALFPGLAALISLYGLVFDPTQVEKQIEVPFWRHAGADAEAAFGGAS